MGTGNIDIITSKDGSHTLLHKELNETYHSTHGAITESKHVFIEKGLVYFKNNYPERTIKVLEVGLGTGLNVLLTIKKALELDLKVEITSLEKYPLERETIKNLNYLGELNWPEGDTYFNRIHDTEWNTTHIISDRVSFRKVEIGLEEFEDTGFNLVFFDAFAPNKQPELWEQKVLKHLANLCENETIFATYCAKGQVRRDLVSAGFIVERLDGPPGKREMLRGTLKKTK